MCAAAPTRSTEASDGTLLVTDIKTGRADEVRRSLKDDPVVAGTKLQLPVYAYAARGSLGGDPVEAQYWFVRREDAGKRIPVVLDADVEQQYAATIATLVGRSRGDVPRQAEREAGYGYVECPYCTPDGIGHEEARARYERKRGAPQLLELLIGARRPRRPGARYGVNGMSLTDQAARQRIACEHRRATSSSKPAPGRARPSRWSTASPRWCSTTASRSTSIAAVTFTEKAGAELRDRLRGEFESTSATADTSDVRARERAAGGARGPRLRRHRHPALLRPAHPDAAPDRGRAAAADRGARRGGLLGRLRRAMGGAATRAPRRPRDMADKVLLALSAGVKLEHLRSLARAFGADWDLIEDRVLPRVPAAGPVPASSISREEAARLAARAPTNAPTTTTSSCPTCRRSAPGATAERQPARP